MPIKPVKAEGKSMTITTASHLIDAAYQVGRLSLEAARNAQLAIRGSYYGMRMTGADRRQMLALRFGVEG